MKNWGKSAMAQPPQPPPKRAKASWRIGRPRTELGIRIAALVGRQPETSWATSEARAFADLKSAGCFNEADIAIVERYYATERKKGREGYHRRTLGTLLNNWRGEVDKARNNLKPVRPRVALQTSTMTDATGAKILVERDPASEAEPTAIGAEVARQLREFREKAKGKSQ